MDQYAGIPITVPAVMQNSLHPLSTSSITACHLLDFVVQGKITEADALTIHLDSTPSRLSAPTSIIPLFYAECFFCHNPPNFSWHLIMLACIPDSLFYVKIG